MHHKCHVFTFLYGWEQYALVNKQTLGKLQNAYMDRISVSKQVDW